MAARSHNSAFIDNASLIAQNNRILGKAAVRRGYCGCVRLSRKLHELVFAGQPFRSFFGYPALGFLASLEGMCIDVASELRIMLAECSRLAKRSKAMHLEVAFRIWKLGLNLEEREPDLLEYNLPIAFEGAALN